MELNNELLDALKAVNRGNYAPLRTYLQNNIGYLPKFQSDIEALLALQRQECAKQAETINISSNPFAPYDIISEESILNAKLF